LSAPATPEEVRKALEARVLAGEAIHADEIRRARRAFNPGRPKDVKQARRMAA
jgi:hypothetical protein